MASRDESAFEITITNFSICCRLCLSSNDSEHYFDISNTSLASQNDITIIEAIQKVTNSEILLSDKLPTKICKLCSTRLDDAYCFIRDFFRTNEMLQNFLYNEEPDRFADDDQIADSYSVVESDEQGDAVTEMELGDLALREQRIFVEEGDEPHPTDPSSGDCLQEEKRDLTAGLYY
uniref:Uncharacterized protein n=1 Tax=Anopheles stephensi TaxID=30069 RepID=A0A182XV25_ANOST